MLKYKWGKVQGSVGILNTILKLAILLFMSDKNVSLLLF